VPGGYCIKEKAAGYLEKLYSAGRVYNSLSCPFNLFLDFITGKADYSYCNTWRDSIVFACLLLQKGKNTEINAD
jgi:hypothetical protein